MATRAVGRRTSPPVSRKRPRQERATLTVDAIVTAVERVLDVHGVAGLTTNRVAEVAGVSVGTLYQYYSNKQALVGALQERVLTALYDALDRALTAGAAQPIPMVAAQVATDMVTIYNSQRPIHRWLIELRTEAAAQEPFMRAVDRFIERLAAFLALREDLRVRDPRAAAFAIVSAIEGVANALAARPGKVDLAGVTAETVRMVVAYLAVPTPG